MIKKGDVYVMKVFGSKTRKLTSLLLVFLLSIASFLPVWAEEVPFPDFSEWAIQDLNEGERYGIYDSSWYFDGFRSALTKEKSEILLKGVEDRLIALGYQKALDFEVYPVDGSITRGEFLGSLYNLLGSYGLAILGTPEEQFTKMGVLRGTYKGNELEADCTAEHAVVFSTRLIQSLYKELDQGSKGFMWSVENEGNKVYLLGSIHIGNSIVYPVNQSMKAAFEESKALLVEANLFDQTGGMEYFMEKSSYQDGTTIKDVIDEDLHGKLLDVLEMYGIPYEAFAFLKPWSLANNLNAIHASSSENLEQGSQAAMLGIDIYFLSNAMVFGLPIIELEGIAFQADMFDTLSKETQMLYLEGIIDAILDPVEDEDDESYLDEWLIKWQNGDHDSFEASFLESMEEEDEESKEMTMMLFGERDKNMTAKIMELLEEEGQNTYFLVVGAGHFTVKDSIIDRLMDAGYNVEYISK